MDRTVAVTQSNIENGVRLIPSKCPIARALNREFSDFGDPYAIIVYKNIILWSDRGRIILHTESQTEVNTFISNFDARKPVKPFFFIVSFNENLLNLNQE